MFLFRQNWRLWGAVVLTPLGCTSEALTVAETDVVLTLEGEGRDYSVLKTYALPSSVIDLCDAVATDPPEDVELPGGMGGFGGSGLTRPETPTIDPDLCITVSHQYDQTVLDTLAEQMDALGYRRITDPTVEQPDVVLMAAYVAQQELFLGTSPGWCDPYYYYGGCWYPSYTYVYTLPTAALIVEMVVTDETKNGWLSSAWTFAAQGLFETSSELSGSQRITRAIEQGFAQSSYLDAGGEK